MMSVIVHTNFYNSASTVMLKNGRIAIVSSHDLLVFDPAKMHVMETPVPDIVITGFILMNISLQVDSLTK